MNSKQLKIGAAFLAIFVVAYYLPLANPKVSAAILEAFKLLQWYAGNHVLACVLPALFIAGGIMTFLSQASVMGAKKTLAFSSIIVVVPTIVGMIYGAKLSPGPTAVAHLGGLP